MHFLWIVTFGSRGYASVQAGIVSLYSGFFRAVGVSVVPNLAAVFASTFASSTGVANNPRLITNGMESLITFIHLLLEILTKGHGHKVSVAGYIMYISSKKVCVGDLSCILIQIPGF